MRKALTFCLILSAVTLAFAAEQTLKQDSYTHKIIKPPASGGASYDLDFSNVTTNLGGGGGTPGGTTTQFQYNNAGAFGGVTYTTYNGTTVSQTAGSRFNLLDSTDPSKKVTLDLSGITTATTRNIAFPDKAGTLMVDLPVGAVIRVDSTNGSASGARGDYNKPFATIAQAVAVATSGDTIVVGSGSFSIGTNTQLPSGVSLVGSGIDVTILTGSAGTSAAALSPGNNSWIADLTIDNSSSPTGSGGALGAKSTNNAFTGVTVTRCKLLGGIDGIYTDRSSIGSLAVYDSIITTAYDAVAHGPTAPTGPWEFYNCNITTTGTSNPGSRPFSVAGGTYRVYGGQLTTGGSTATNNVVSASTSAVVELYGCRIRNTGGGSVNTDLAQAGSATLGVSAVSKNDGSAPSTSGTITQLSRYALRDNNLSDLASTSTALSNLGGVPTTRTLSIAGTSFDLSANRTWTQDNITGLGSNGLVKRTGANTLAIATAKTDYWDTSDFVASGGSHAKGLVPDPGASSGTTKFLREDATWSVPAGGGNVSNVGTPTDGQIAQWDSSTTIRGVTPTSPIVSDGAANTITLNVGVDHAFTVPQSITQLTATTSSPVIDFTLGTNSSGTPANGFGESIKFTLATSTTPNTDAARLDAVWGNATHASRTSYFDFLLVNNTAALASAARLFASGSMSVGSTTDPSAAGIINANTGFRVANAASTGNVLRGNGTNFVSAQLAYSDLSGTPTIPTGSNPTASVGLSAVNGSAATFLRSDGAPALSQSITPTWSGAHTFQVAPTVTVNNGTTNAVDTLATLNHDSTGTPASGLGGRLAFGLEDSTTADVVSGALDVVETTVTHNSNVTYMDFNLLNNSTLGSKMRLFSGGGLSVNSTTDPGTGIINANTGFKLANAEFPIAANGLVKRTAANAYSAATAGTDYLNAVTAPITNTSGNVGFDQAAAFTWTGQHTHSPARTIASGASAVWDDVNLSAQTTTVTGGTNITTAKGFNKVSIYKPTVTDSTAMTITNAASLYIEDAPAVASSAVITNPYALWVDNGNVRIDSISSGIVKSTSGTLSTATAKTDYWDTTDFVASGGSHAHGLVPDPGASAGTTKFLREDATWVVPSGGSGSPGGSNTQVQFNDSGAFGGDAGLTYDKTNDQLLIANGSVSIPSVAFQSATTTGIYGGGTLGFAQGGAGIMGIGSFNPDGANLRSASGYGWSSTSDPFASADTRLNRNAAGVVEINNGTTGQWGGLKLGKRDSATNATADVLVLGHQSTGTPAASLGTGILFNIDSSTTADQNAGRISTIWTTATDASRTAAMDFGLENNGGIGITNGLMRLYGSGGLSVGNTTDPGAGIISANTGYWVGTSAPTVQQVLRSDGTAFKGVDVGAWDGIAKVSGSDYTNSTTSLTDVTGLSTGSLTASTLYEFECVMQVNSSSTAGMQVAITNTGTGTGAIYTWSGTGTNAAATGIAVGSNASGTACAAFCLVNGDGEISMKGHFKTSTTGTPGMKIQALKTTSGTATVRIGSVLKWRKA